LVLKAADLGGLLQVPVTHATDLAGDGQSCAFLTTGFSAITVSVRPGLGRASLDAWSAGKMSLAVLEKALGFPAQRISRYISVPSAETDCDLYEITIKRLSEDDMVNVVRKVASLPNVREALKTSD